MACVAQMTSTPWSGRLAFAASIFGRASVTFLTETMGSSALPDVGYMLLRANPPRTE